MLWTIVLSSFAVSIVLLGALSIKCKIGWRIGLLSSVCIGFITALLVSGIHHTISKLSFLSSVCVEIIILCALTFFLILLRFFRDPERTVPNCENVILSPADGTIRYVHTVEKGKVPVALKKGNPCRLNELTKTEILYLEAIHVGIEMSVLDVHVNRAPVKGKIIYQKRTEGKFLSLRKTESVFENERVTTVIHNGEFKVAVIQIASRLVRRIVSYLKEGDSVDAGQRIGMIRFGSQVDVIFPRQLNARIHVRAGDKVKAGISIIGES